MVKVKFGKTSKESQNITKLIVADIKEFISDKLCHHNSHFQITFISAPVNVVKSNVIEFYPFLTASSIDLMPTEFYWNLSAKVFLVL